MKYIIPFLISTCLFAQADVKAKALVKEAIVLGKTKGRDALIKEVNQASGRFHVKNGDDLYIFIYDFTGTCLAIGYQGNLVGINRIGVKDPDGKLLIQEIIKTGKSGSGWVDYKYPDPKTGMIKQKSSYVEGLENVVVGCGIYK